MNSHQLKETYPRNSETILITLPTNSLNKHLALPWLTSPTSRSTDSRITVPPPPLWTDTMEQCIQQPWPSQNFLQLLAATNRRGMGPRFATQSEADVFETMF